MLGGVALLVWGMRMVQVGLNQAFGADLRRMIGISLRNRWLAWLTGLGVTAVLQSSTASAMLTVSFAREGLVDTAPGLAVMLGAGVGTSLVAQVLAFDLSWLAPLLILGGVLGYFSRRHSKQENLSQAAIGLGLMLLALHAMVALSQPLRDSLVLRDLLDAASEPLLLVILGALITWAAHSSLAIVLLVISLAGAGVVSVPMGLALVLGANLGGAMPPLIATLGSAPEARRIPLGNLLSRLAGVVLVLLLLPQITPWVQRLGVDPGRLMAHFHTAFNLALSIGLIGLTTPLARVLARLLPERPASEYTEQPRYL
ncbi:MAG TPA: Na/Pi cotransporter family protein, partial [bacterium]|nr:Na/Pi cotransporter family protein [bacterium]